MSENIEEIGRARLVAVCHPADALAGPQESGGHLDHDSRPLHYRTCAFGGGHFRCPVCLWRPTTRIGAARHRTERFPGRSLSRPADQEALRVTRLVEFVEKSRRMAVRNPLLLADVGYYEAELAASRRCLQAVATG
jgi:hypothetical protein